MSDHHEYVHDCECHDCLRVTVRKRNAELTEVKAQRDDLIAELAIIRKVVSDCSFALGTGAFLTSGASISIMRELPSEIRKTVVMLKAHAFMADEDADALRARLQSTPAPVAQKVPDVVAYRIHYPISGEAVTTSGRDYEAAKGNGWKVDWLGVVGGIAAQAKDDGFATPDCPDCACVQDGQCLCTPSKPPAGAAAQAQEGK